MRVVPRNDSLNWIFLEPSKDVFLPGTTKIQEQSFTTSDNSLPLHNEFHIDLCEDAQQLIQAYFRRFIIEGLDKPWHAFAGGWRTPSLAKFFGIDPVFIKGDFRYMLVRVLMVRKAGRIAPLPNVTVTPELQEFLNDFRSKDYQSSFNFFNEVGTHYISSFLTGNSIYQVFVYDQQGYDAVKRRLSETGWVRSSYMAQLPYLLPLWVKHMGKVMLLNADPQTTQHIREALTIRFLFSVYPNIFKMHDNSDLVRLVEKYLKAEPDGLLGLELKTLDVVFRDPAKRKWFMESLQQTMQLWEINLR
jgi:torso-like protein